MLRIIASIVLLLQPAYAALLIQIFQGSQDTSGLYNSTTSNASSLPGAATLESMSFGASTTRSLGLNHNAFDSSRPSVNYINIVKEIDDGSLALWRNVLDREMFASVNILKTLDDGTVSMFWKLENAVVVEYDGNLMSGNVSTMEHVTLAFTTMTYGMYPKPLPNGQTNGPAYIYFDLQSNTLYGVA